MASDFNTVRIPRGLSRQAGATIGVAYVAAALALGVCMGVDFGSVLGGPDLLGLVRSLGRDALPLDIRDECFEGIHEAGRAKAGDWIAVWGGECIRCVMIWVFMLTVSVPRIFDIGKHRGAAGASRRPARGDGGGQAASRASTSKPRDAEA